MKNALLVTAAMLASTGCRSHSVKQLDFVLTPNAEAASVTFECSRSSTGHCLINLASQIEPSHASVPEGQSITFKVAPGTTYCVETTQAALDHCPLAPLPTKREKSRMKVTNDQGA
jgi:hypothetical protein